MATIGDMLRAKGRVIPATPIGNNNLEVRLRLRDDLRLAMLADEQAEEERYYLNEMGCGDPEH